MDTPRIFTRENLSAPENRINVALFGLMTVKQVRSWLLDRLDLPSDCVIYPPTNLASDSRRPDLAVVDPASDEVRAYIEVEIGSDPRQLAGYRTACAPIPVFGLWGTRAHEGDLSLEELADHLDAIHGALDDQQARYNVDHLRAQIRDALAGWTGDAYKRAPVSDAMLASPFLAGLLERLGSLVRLGPSTVMAARTVSIDTNMPNGFSVRVYAARPSKRSLSVLSRSGGRPFIVFQSLEKMRHYLPHKADVLAELERLVRDMGGDMTSISMRGKTSVPLEVAEEHIDELAAIVRSLAK